MKYRNLGLTGLIVLVTVLAMAPPISAAVVSYQGVLTDAGGDPVADGNYSLHVAFFDDSLGGTKLWEETHPNVLVTNGAFNLLLGSIDPISDGWYGAQSAFDVFFEVDVDGNGPFTPRTQITSVPQAMNTHRVSGDILTGPGLLEMHPPEPGVVGGPMYPGFRLSADSLVSKWKLFVPGAAGEDDTCGGMEGTVETELVELNLSMDTDPADPCDSLPGLKLAVDADKARLFMQRHNGGSSVDITSNVGPDLVMTEPVSMTEINLGAAPSQGGLLAMSSKSASSNDSNAVEVMTSSSGAEININHIPGGPTHSSTMAISTGPTSGVSMFMFNPQPEPPADPSDAAILLNTTPGSGASMLMFNPQPEPPAMPWLAIGTDLGGAKDANIGGNIGLLMFNPQPEPPAEPQLEMLSSAMGGRFSLAGAESDNTDGNSALRMIAEEAQASLTVAHDFMPPFGGNDSNKVEIHTDSAQASLSLFGGPADVIPDIVMTANSSDGGMVGINTDAPTEALYVVGNIIATGNITALTDTKVKTNVETVQGALDKVSALRGVTYDMRRDEYPELKLSDERQLGFLADEVEQVVPQVVLGEGDNLKSVDYGRLTPLLVEAIKELKQQNEQLKRRIEQLESR
ncbi:MAG: tail fiber domain-containing protein [candidate division Zixibacteria bacterium]|nr:tail fiber domain-containing protein [candidate division Zixibacteria bacterium]MDH3938467.1 tail fiber domain-containing protein [candidate division Zixibacteria bacterium]MDH4033219.1 tail fiber domain-containing protein [candidate division Zixibacteria bacterium]